MHFVYEAVEKNRRKGNSLTVLGFFIEIASTCPDEERSKEWKKLFDASERLTNETGSSVSQPLNVSLLMGKALSHFWRYRGSLTVPPCSENVLWNVFEKPICLPPRSLSRLRQQFTFLNARSPQDLFSRQVFRSFPDGILPSTGSFRRAWNVAHLFILSSLSLFIF